MKRTIIFAALMIAASVTILGQTSDKKSGKDEKAKEEVIALVKEYNNAIVKKDAVAMERILADDFYEISTGGTMAGRTLAVRGLKESSAEMPYPEAIDVDDIWTIVRVYENTAVLTTRITFKWKESKEELAKWKWLPLNDDGYLITVVAVKKNGNWQIVSMHESVFGMKGQISKD